MIRNLKVLGLALVALFAMSAVVASGASAQTLGTLTSETGEKEELTLTGKEIGKEENRLTVGTDFVECEGSTFTGHAVKTFEQTKKTEEEGEKHRFLPHGASEVTVTPHYLQVKEGTANCNATGGLSATVTMNGCDFRLYDFTTTPIEANGTYGFTAELACPEGKHVDVHIYTGHGHLFQVCKNTITPGAGLSGAHATNENNHIVLKGTIKGFIVHKSGLCGSEEVEGHYDINVTVDAHNTLNETVGATISH